MSTYISGYNVSDPTGNERKFQQDVADLQLLREAGISDLYINPVSSASKVPVWAWQYLLDYLDDSGWSYGIELTAAIADKPVELYYPHATEASGQFKALNVVQSGEVTVTAETNFVKGISELLSSSYVVVHDATGAIESSGQGTLEYDASGKLLFKANIALQLEGVSHTVYFVPKISGSIRPAVNFLDDREAYLSALRNISYKLECGSGLRFFVDLTYNEMGFYNQNESARLSMPSFNAKYALWLKQKYGTTDKLNEAWKIEPPVTSFDEAAKLIPVYTSNKDENNNSHSYYIHMDDGTRYYSVDTHTGVSWNDYLDARDDLYLEFNNAAADAVKESVNLPVIYKHCSVQRRYLINKALTGGFDGLGSEAYGSPERVASTVGITSTQGDQFARTAWIVVTETNTEENIDIKYNSGQWSYPTKEDMFERFDKMMANGAKGIFDFLLCDRYDLGGKLGQAYSYVQNTNVLPWVSEYISHVSNTDNQTQILSQKYKNKTFYMYPQQKNWWYNSNERGAVQLLDDTAQLLRTMTQSGNYVLRTDDVNVDTKILFVNISDGPYSQIYGPALSELIHNNVSNKRIVILGHRNDLGSIPEIDRYFSNEKVVVSENQTVQILLPTPTSVILKMTSDGKPWALRDGNLYIIATSDIAKRNGEFDILNYVDELGIASAPF